VKKMFLVLAFLAVGLFAASGVMAAALGPHHYPTASTNPCKYCHDTASGTPALRGWNGTPPAGVGTWGAKPLSNLCYQCHTTGHATGAHGMSTNAYDNNNHGSVAANIAESPNGAAQAGMTTSSLPYTLGAGMECTTCHNVHVTNNRPFNQRAGYQTLCNNCHAGRANDTATRTTTAASGRNYSTHPTNRTIAPVNATNLKLVAGINNNLKVATPAPASGVGNGYALGGHLNDAAGNTGTMDCQTCHAVHGPTQGSTIGINDLLAVANDTVTATNPANNLCEGCHYGGNAGQQVGTFTTAVAADSDHPIDARTGRAFYPSAMIAPQSIPGWVSQGAPNSDRGAQPLWSGTGTSTGGTPVCSSCHDTHGGIVGTPLLRGPVDGSTLFTFSYDVWCFLCHVGTAVTPNNHHSVLNTGTSQLSCGDCHGDVSQGDTWKAHNGFWNFPITISGTNSAICESCHLYNDPTAIVTPGPKGQTITAFTLPSSHGTNRGSGAGSSHQASSSTIAVALSGTANIVLSPNWATAGATGPARVSQYGNTNQPICESCHNILTNGGTTQNATAGFRGNLLLLPYEDDTAGTITGAEVNDYYGSFDVGTGNTGDAFCRACHVNTNPGVGNTGFVHNPGAHTVPSYSYDTAVVPRPYGRTTATVMTTPIDSTASAACPESSTADATGAPGVLSYPASNSVNCDSCHRPHNADVDSIDAANGRYLILETTDTNWGTTICAQCHNTDVQCVN